MPYEKPEAGEWVQPIEDGYRLACCDCGLVHTMDFRVHQGRAQFRVWRNSRATAQLRRFIDRIPWTSKFYIVVPKD